jgi:hypothetical protein
MDQGDDFCRVRSCELFWGGETLHQLAKDGDGCLAGGPDEKGYGNEKAEGVAGQLLLDQAKAVG